MSVNAELERGGAPTVFNLLEVTGGGFEACETNDYRKRRSNLTPK